MSLIKKYAIHKILHENEGCIVYRAKRIADDLGVIIKMLKSGAIDHDAAVQLTQEYQILSDLSHECIPKIVEVVTLPSQYCIVFEDIGAVSLHELLSKGTLPLSESLLIAVKMVKTLGYLHQKHIIHADVNPKNIVYNPQTKEVLLIDYGYSVIDNNFRFNSDIHVGTSGNLLYMSPEQTGRTKQRIDFRSDLYSFGMTLYHLFSGKAPYDAKNRYELIHKQVAMIPKSLNSISPEIPDVVSRIVDKLIAKKPELRYGSDQSLLYDLQECLSRLDENGIIADFEITQHEGKPIRIGERLYGREGQLALLNQALQRMLNDGPVSILVTGHTGVGKTRLIEEFLTYAQLSTFTVLGAKFELHKVALPYTTFKQLFAQLGTWMLTRAGGEQKVSLSPVSTQVLSHLFTELHAVLKSSHTYGIQPIENLNHKLPFAMQELFCAVATQHTPIILFIDDLQWADPQSLELIKNGLLNIRNPYLHFVGSYRDEEADLSRIKEIFYEKNRLVELLLEPLLEEDIVHIIEEVLGESGKKVTTLGALLYTKTLGNPFYLKTMLEELIELKLLVHEKGRWQYTLDTIKIHSASSNIATIINRNFEKLSAKQRTYLSYLALFGSRYTKLFTMDMMRALGYESDLMEALAHKGFLELTKKEYAFVHDQIQEHVYRSMSEGILRSYHLKIGSYLEDAYSRGDYGDLNAMVHHLNHGYAEGKFPKKLFLLNIMALEEILTNTSYTLALRRMRWVDAHLFDETLWSTQRSRAYRYGQLKCRILYLNGEHDEALSSVQDLMRAAHNVHERLECFRVLKNICVTQGKNFQALLEYGNTLLTELGMDVPREKSSLENVIAGLNQSLTSHPLFKNPKAILALPSARNAKHQHVVSLLVDYWEAAYYLAELERMQWSYLTIIAQSFGYGNTTESAFAYVLLGGQFVREKKYKQAYAFGDLALKLNAQFNDESMLPKVHNFMANFISPYVKSLGSNIALYQKSLYQSKLNGDIVFGTWANFLMLFSDFLSGHSLEEFRHNVVLNSDFILASGDTKMIDIFKIMTHCAAALQEQTSDNEEEEAKAIALWEKDRFYPALAWYAIIKAQTCLLLGEFEEGLEYCSKYIRTTANEVIMFPKMRLHFVRALLLMGKKTPLTHDEQKLLNEDLAECQSLIQVSSSNFKFAKLLLKAEQMKGVVGTWEVAHVYDDAIKAAQESKNAFYITLGGLCASRFWGGMFFNDLSRFYLHEAIVGLNAWGAYEIAVQLNGLTPQTQYITADVVPSISSGHSSIRAEPANFQSILDAFYAISRSLDSTQLMDVLMQKILENATASRVILILKEAEEYYTKATIDFAQGKVEMRTRLLSQSPLLPQKVIRYALNTGENVLLDNPVESDIFSSDGYIQTFKPASCAAITSSVEGVVSAVLYLENASVATPLNSESIRTLELLLTHSTIVLKNTLLFESLAKNSEELNKAQEIAHVGSWKFNASTGAIEWSAEVYRIYEMIPFSQDIDNDWFFTHLHPDDIELVQSSVEKALHQKRSYNLRHRILTAQGNIRFVHQRAQTYWENDVQKMSGTIQDVTDYEDAKTQISRLNQVVDQNPFSTIITDSKGIIQYVNQQTLIMTGYFEEELMGQKMSLFSSGRHPKKFYSELWDTISRKKQMWRGTIINTIKNGENRDCSSTIFPILGHNHEVLNFVTIQEDVTQKNIKDKLFMMQTRQAQMGEMLSMIAHQWRQPLSVISALMNKQRVDIALETHTVEGFIQSIGEVDTQVQYLSRTISDFRDFFKPDKEQTRTTTSEMFTKALGLIGHTLKHENIEIIQTHVDDEPYLTYEHEMVQVFLNLFKNAQDAFAERNISNRRLIITSHRMNDERIISVEDNAQGIDSRVLDTLFLPYVSTKNQQNGTGLGLYMSKTIVEEHCQGNMRVENTHDGAKFTITIPIKDHDGTV